MRMRSGKLEPHHGQQNEANHIQPPVESPKVDGARVPVASSGFDGCLWTPFCHGLARLLALGI